MTVPHYQLYASPREGGRLAPLVPRDSELVRLETDRAYFGPNYAGFGYVLDTAPRVQYVGNYRERSFSEGAISDALSGPVAIIVGGYTAGTLGTALAGGAAAAGGATVGAAELGANVGFTVANDVAAGYVAQGYLVGAPEIAAFELGNVGFAVADDVAAGYLLQGYIPGVEIGPSPLVTSGDLGIVWDALPTGSGGSGAFRADQFVGGSYSLASPSWPNIPGVSQLADAAGSALGSLLNSTVGALGSTLARTLFGPPPLTGAGSLYPSYGADTGAAGQTIAALLVVSALALGAYALLKKGKA